jgi:hypothetical protein
MTTYADFLASKVARREPAGRPCNPEDVHPFLHDWQREVVAWAVRTGRAALWEDTGLGKSVQQLQFAQLTSHGRAALIVAPLAVCQQTVQEATKVDLEVRYTRTGGALTPGLWITNYELADRFDPHALTAVVLDEASILKQSDGKTRTMLIRHFAATPYRLTATATPAPNDIEELTNQAEFLGIARRVDMLSTYFVNDPKTKGWRVKGHARNPMFRWMADWAIALRRPSDLGYPDAGYILPPLDIVPEIVEVPHAAPEGQLFATPADLGGVGGRAKVRRATLDARCERAAKLVYDEPDEPWLLWCGLNAEADRLSALLPDAVDVRGAWSPEQKAEAILAFANGGIKQLVIKPQIAAFGVNWQHCARMAFVGMNDSYEAMYQGIRRCWRYGQNRPVRAHIVLSDIEAAIAENVARKERHAARLMDDLVAAMRHARTEVAA